MSTNKNKSFIKTCITAVILFTAVLSAYLLWKDGIFLPGWISWETRSFCDESGVYEVSLCDKIVHVIRDDEEIWSSPSEYKVQDVLCADIDSDKEDELVLLCWKVGRYGKARPFWVDDEEAEVGKWSQHLFVYEFKDKKIKAKWMSSYLGTPVAGFCFDGSRILFADLSGHLTAWRWGSWGFSKENTDVSFICFGDNLIHEPVYAYALNKNDGSFDYLYEDIRAEVSEYDIAVINQETPFVDDLHMVSDYPRFGTPAAVGDALKNAGFDIATCATNHALDKGMQGINTTCNAFDDLGITYLGIQPENETEYLPYKIITKNGIRFALLNYTYGTNGVKLPKENPNAVHILYDKEKVAADINAAKNDSDVVIVFTHWGTEYSEDTDDFQKEWADVYLKAGVDVVVGTHPHVVQDYEMLKDSTTGHEMLVFYSLGNLVTDKLKDVHSTGASASFTISPCIDKNNISYKISSYSLKYTR